MQGHSTSGTGSTLAVFYKTAGSSEPSSYTCTSSDSFANIAAFPLFEPSGASVIYDTGATAFTPSTTTITSPSITPNAGADPWERILCFFFNRTTGPIVTPQNYGTYLGNDSHFSGSTAALSFCCKKGVASATPSATSNMSDNMLAAQVAFCASSASTGAGRMMSRGVVYNLNGATSVKLLSDVADHDLMIALAFNNGPVAITSPSGWTDRASSIAVNGVSSRVSTRPASGDAAATYNWTNGGGNQQTIIGVFFNQDSATAGPAFDVAAVQNNAASTSQATPTVTTTHANDIVLSLFTSTQTPSGPRASSDSWLTDTLALNCTSNFGQASTGVAPQSGASFALQAVAGASTAKTFTLSSAANICAQVAIVNGGATATVAKQPTIVVASA
ncbi:MAG TPA: hypothetical protein VH187_01670 [Scandinavium sp.]|uniref:hypothetical protein n=1 Tax=Scandinavium sp. TaxID=2830653 RepID=UPI002E3811CE|nr:hypothetical protein [Scandinavium sp.]HEX4499867.1 hypothetical protein [Scandinavium sp.]